jgi:DNA helicase-2/ATP-dependent DNA helicase PcrA
VAQAAGRAGPRPPVGEVNPVGAGAEGLDWPSRYDRERLAQVAELAQLVEAWRDPAAAGRSGNAAALAHAPAEVRQQVAELDAAGARLLAGAGSARGVEIAVPVPETLTTSQVVRASRAPSQLAAALARPWPRKPSAAGRIGQAFHLWRQESALKPALLEDLDFDYLTDDSQAGDELVGEVASLDKLRTAFESGRFAALVPVAVEKPFALAFGDRQIRGRIDAVYDRATAPAVVPESATYLVVDWKTGSSRPDPLQLSFYRLAWARLAAVPPESVAVAFYHVGQDRLDYPEEVLDEVALTRLVTDLGQSR